MRFLIAVLSVSLLLQGTLFAQAEPVAVAAKSANASQQIVGSVNFTDKTFKDVLGFVAEKTKTQIGIDWRDLAVNCGILPSCKVSFSGENLSAAQCLDLALARVKTARVKGSSRSRRGAPAAWYINSQGFRIVSRRQMLGMTHKPYESLKRDDEDAAKHHSARNIAPRRLRPVALSFDDRPASEVMDYFKQALAAQGIKNFIVRWSALEEIGIDQDTPVTLMLNSKIGVMRAIDLALEAMSNSSDPLNKPWCVNDQGVYVITSGEQLNHKLTTQSWYIGDLLMTRPNFSGPTIGLDSRETDGSTSDSIDDNTDTDTTQQARQNIVDNLTQSITNSIGQQYWQPQGKGVVRVFKNHMLVTQTQLGFMLLSKATGLK